jgi:hypothetical protein
VGQDKINKSYPLYIQFKRCDKKPFIANISYSIWWKVRHQILIGHRILIQHLFFKKKKKKNS